MIVAIDETGNFNPNLLADGKIINIILENFKIEESGKYI